MTQDTLFSAQALGKRVAATVVATSPAKLDQTGVAIRVVNHGPNDAFFAVTEASTNATVPAAGIGVASCTTVLAGSDITLGLKSGNTPLFFSAITETGTAALDVFISNGI